MFIRLRHALRDITGRGLMRGLCALAWLLMMLASSQTLADKAMLASLPVKGVTLAPLQITLGKADLIDVPGSVADVLVADPSVIDVVAVQSNRLYVVGMNVGDTNLIALDSNGDVIKRLDVHVSYDLQAIQALVEKLFPDESAKVSAIHDQILLTGKVSTPAVASRIANLVGHYVSDLQDEDNKTVDELISNLMEVRGEQQVMLQVRIVEASRNILKQLGLDATTTGGAGDTIFRVAPGGGLGFGQEAVGVFNLLQDTGLSGLGTLDLQLEALEEEGMANILAEPNLTAVSGEQAGFLAGGEFPVPVGRDQIGNLVIEFREFGVSLNFRPVVLSESRINLQLNTEVSSLDTENAIILAEVEVPGLDVRRAETTVEIPSGGSLMIAGLLQSEAIRGMSGLPGIRKAPILGDLISSNNFQRNETELVVIVTPYIVKPFAEQSRAAERKPEMASNPLADMFANNLKRIYRFEDEPVLSDDIKFGYILD